MMRWLLKQWHRLTLGRTVSPFKVARSPYQHTGTLSAVAVALDDAARRSLPLCVTYEVAQRRATDLDMGHVRIVLETGE